MGNHFIQRTEAVAPKVCPPAVPASSLPLPNLETEGSNFNLDTRDVSQQKRSKPMSERQSAHLCTIKSEKNTKLVSKICLAAFRCLPIILSIQSTPQTTRMTRNPIERRSGRLSRTCSADRHHRRSQGCQAWTKSFPPSQRQRLISSKRKMSRRTIQV